MESHEVQVVVADPHLLDTKIAAIRSAAPSKLQVDATDKVQGQWLSGTKHGLLQQENPEYNNKRRQLYEYCHPLEFSPTIPIEQKTMLMEECVYIVVQSHDY